MNEDLNFITLKIYVKNILSIVSLILKIAMIVYFAANFWLVFVFFSERNSGDFFDYNDYNEEDFEFEVDHINNYPTFLINSDWNIVQNQDKLKVVLISMYFMMTSLSTVGFGDFYPKSNFERIFGSIILLSGVAIFSYIMSKLATMMINFNNFNGDSEDNEVIDKFFTLLKKFNGGFSIS